MEEKRTKYGLPLIDAEMYAINPDRYLLRSGDVEDAPSCPFGNRYEWVVFDKQNQVYVRVTKSVLKKLLSKKQNK